VRPWETWSVPRKASAPAAPAVSRGPRGVGRPRSPGRRRRRPRGGASRAGGTTWRLTGGVGGFWGGAHGRATAGAPSAPPPAPHSVSDPPLTPLGRGPWAPAPRPARDLSSARALSRHHRSSTRYQCSQSRWSEVRSTRWSTRPSGVCDIFPDAREPPTVNVPVSAARRPHSGFMWHPCA